MYKLVYISSERLLAKKGPIYMLLKDDANFWSLIRYVILDEAHFVVTWGSSFRSEYANVVSIREVLDNFNDDCRIDERHIPVGIFTATASPNRIKDVMRIMSVALTIR